MQKKHKMMIQLRFYCKKSHTLAMNSTSKLNKCNAKFITTNKCLKLLKNH